jgi:hypothetical protein
MEQLFIKNIINKELYSKLADIDLEGIFNYSPDKEEIIKYIEKSNLEYEFILNNLENTSPLTEEEEKIKEEYITKISEEFIKIKKIFEYLIVNVDINKVIIPHYKIYDYNDTPAFIKKKISKKTHLFNLQTFLIKNKVNKDDIINFAAKIQNLEVKMINKEESKIMLFFVIYKIFELYTTYDKCIRYTLELLKEYPHLMRYKDEYLINVDEKYFNISNDEINITHFNEIKYANNKHVEKDKVSILNSTFIKFVKNKNKNYEILFK